MKAKFYILQLSFVAALLFCCNLSYAQQYQLKSNGSAGNVTISSTQTVNSYAHVTAINGNLVTYTGSVTFAAGDKVLIIQMLGGTPGTWQFDTVITGGNPFTTSSIHRSFSVASGGVVQVVKVPQYRKLKIAATGKLTATAWNGTTGGILAFMVADTLKIDSGGRCNVSGLGYTASNGGANGVGGAGGAGGAADTLGHNGGTIGLVVGSGIGGGGDGGLRGALPTSGTNSPSLTCPGCGSYSQNYSNLQGSTLNTYLLMGGAGSGGAGGQGGQGAGGGGGGANGSGTGQNGTAGGSGGTGGIGGNGGNGSGIVVFTTGFLMVANRDTPFVAIGDTATSGTNATAGGNGGNGGLGGGTCLHGGGGGGGGGADGGKGGGAGSGGSGGTVMPILFNVSPSLHLSSYNVHGGKSGNPGLGGHGGYAGSNAGIPGYSCVISGGSGPPPPGPLITSNDSCDMNVVLKTLDSIGVHGGTPIGTSHLTGHTQIYARPGDTVWVDHLDSFTVIVYTLIRGRVYYTVIADTAARTDPFKTIDSLYAFGNVRFDTLQSGMVYGRDTFQATCPYIFRAEPGDGSPGLQGAYGADGETGDDGGDGTAGSTVLSDCNTNPITNNFVPGIGYGCITTGLESAVEAATQGGDGNYIFDIASTDYGIYTEYDLYVIDGEGCTGTFNTDVYAVTNINPEVLYTVTLACPGGGSGGALSVSVIDPNATFNPPCGNEDLFNYIVDQNGYVLGSDYLMFLPAGSYTIFYGSAATGDTLVEYVNIEEATTVDVQANVIQPSCIDPYSGEIDVTISGGNPQLQWNYGWSTFSYGYQQTNLSAGSYDLSVTYYWYGYPEIIEDNPACPQVYTYVLSDSGQVTTSESAIVCQGQSYTYNGAQYPAGSYAVTLSNPGGCDTLVNLTVTEYGTTPGTDYQTICDGQLLTWNGTVYNQSGSYTAILPSATVNGCDSTVTLYLTVLPPIDTDIYDTIAGGQSVTVGTSVYFIEGDYTDVLTSATGCDSIVHLYLTVLTSSQTWVYDTVCPGASVSVGVHQYAATGTYIDTLVSSTGTDSIITTDLYVRQAVTLSIHDTICSGQSYTLGSNNYTQSGTFTSTFASQYGCESVVTLFLTVQTPLTGAASATICQGQSFAQGNNLYTQSGTYRDTLTAQSGCDSVVTLTLTVSAPLTQDIVDTICQGESYAFGGSSYTATGTYTNTLSSVGSCDTLQTLHLVVLQSATPTLVITVSHGPLVNGLQTDTFRASYTGCDGAYYSWYLNLQPVGVHDSLAVITYLLSQGDSIICRIDCQNRCASTVYSFSNRVRTGLSSLDAFVNDISVYPNPNKGAFTLEISSMVSKDASISVSDMLGQSVMSDRMTLTTGGNKRQITLDENVVSGMYIIAITIEGHTAYQKISVER